MCGIAGILFADPACRPEESALRALGDAIAHRGPDAEGYLSEPGVGLVHRRLSIIDLSGGNQPVGNEDGSVQVVFNGEIYNFQELRADLERRGHRFRTRSDTEVLVHLYEEEGDELVRRLRGMFAFAIWDRPRRRLLLARDRLGIKPLYFYRDARMLAFASELKPLLTLPGVDRALDAGSLEDYLALGFVPGARSIFRRVAKLPPAHALAVTADTLDADPRRYWQLRFRRDRSLSPRAWCEAVRAKVEESVRMHMIADVPVGAFLSGGVDSSVVVACASRLSPEPLRTFSIGFREEKFSELPFAREVARRYGTEHEEEVVTPDAVELLDDLTHFYDEPFADSSAVPTYLVSRLAARRVKVVLSGDGGDEAFGGYKRYAADLREATARRWVPGWAQGRVLAPLAAAWPRADWLPRPLRAKNFLKNLSLDPARAYANTLAVCRDPLRSRLLAPALPRHPGGPPADELVRDAYASAPARDPLAGMIAADVGVVLPDDYLVKVDRASMAHGLELRPPLLDHELMELSATIPSTLKVRGRQTKWVFKRAFRDDLPPSSRNRPKQGFEVPLDDWLRGPLRDMFADAVLAPSAPAAALIDRPAAREVFDRHLSGASNDGPLLWALLVLARWTDRYAPSL